MTKELGSYSVISVQHALEALLSALATVSRSQPPIPDGAIYEILVSTFDDESKDNLRLVLSKKDDYEELRDYVLNTWNKQPKNDQS